MPRRDVLLEPPRWAPAWLPSLRRTGTVRALRVAIGIVLVAGVVACFSEGADAPADPTLAPVDDGADAAVPDQGSTAEDASVCENPAADFSPETETLLSTFGVASVEITEGDLHTDLCVLTASTSQQRARGLMQVTEFDGFDGMVFLYDADSSGAYYMFNTPTPLTIYWWDAEGSLVSSAEMEPCLDLPAAECARYPSNGAYRYALEVPLGALDGHVSDGSRFSLEP